MAPTTDRRSGQLQAALDRLYDECNRPDCASDPILLVRRYPDPADREVVGYCAAALAFGRVEGILHTVERLTAAMGPSPASFVRRFEPARDADLLLPLVHRWIRGPDIVALLVVLQSMIREAGSIEQFFLRGHNQDATDVGPAIESFSVRALCFDLRPVHGRVPRRPGVHYFFPRPSAGSGCKRANLFLRWMVRRDEIDCGLWTGVSPSQLVVPLDTHVVRVARCLGLTRYRSPGWRMAADITASLRALDPRDPVKYDFALCHLGMSEACGFRRPHRDAQCPLRGLCRPSGDRRRASRRPSDRR